MARRRIGIIGLGMAVTPHAKSLVDLKDRVEVAYAFSRTAERRSSFAVKFPFPLTDSIDTILDDDSVDAVMVLTTPDCHLEIVRQCAAAGKHILLEKPLDISTERAVELIRACRDAGVRLGVVLQHRYRPAGLKLREILASGRLGRLASASAYMPLWRPQKGYYDRPGRGDKARDGGGVLLTQGIHTLDLFLSLVGVPLEVAGYAGTSCIHEMETEDVAAAALRFENGALGCVDATTCAYPGFPERIQVLCENGTAVITGTELNVAFHDGGTEHVAADLSVGGTGADPMDFPQDFHRAVLADFLDALDADRDPWITGEEALKAHRFIDAILQSGAAGRPVSVIRD